MGRGNTPRDMRRCAPGTIKAGDGAKLFESGWKKNPYHRVALLNLWNVLFQLKDAERMGPVLARISNVEVRLPMRWPKSMWLIDFGPSLS